MNGDENNQQHIFDWRVPARYGNLRPIGHGAFGSVCSSDDSVSGRSVAIKKLVRHFISAAHAERTYRELYILLYMKHDNVISLLDTFTPQTNRTDFKDIYLVTPLMDSNLDVVIKTGQLRTDHIKFITCQILRALKYIHSAGIIHRDLKPANIGVNADCSIKILDFGLSRQVDDHMTDYVVTREYRAPEITLNFSHYDGRVDIWAMACILAEMYMGRHLFHGITDILELVGSPDQEVLAMTNNDTTWRNLLNRSAPLPRKDYVTYFKAMVDDPDVLSIAAIDLLDRMLVLNPDHRINVADSLAHPFLAEYHDEDDNESISVPIEHPSGNINANLEWWKDLLWEYIATVGALLNQKEHSFDQESK